MLPILRSRTMADIQKNTAATRKVNAVFGSL